MKKIFLDTNIWLRFFLKDDKTQFKYVHKLISLIEEGRFKAYTSTIVFLEINYVLKNIYKFEFREIIDSLEAIKKVRGITLIEKTNLELALKFYKKYKIKLADCLITSQLAKNMILISFDKDFEKIKEITFQEPRDLIKKSNDSNH